MGPRQQAGRSPAHRPSSPVAGGASKSVQEGALILSRSSFRDRSRVRSPYRTCVSTMTTSGSWSRFFRCGELGELGPSAAEAEPADILRSGRLTEHGRGGVSFEARALVPGERGFPSRAGRAGPAAGAPPRISPNSRCDSSFGGRRRGRPVRSRACPGSRANADGNEEPAISACADRRNPCARAGKTLPAPARPDPRPFDAFGRKCDGIRSSRTWHRPW